MGLNFLHVCVDIKLVISMEMGRSCNCNEKLFWVHICDWKSKMTHTLLWICVMIIAIDDWKFSDNDLKVGYRDYVLYARREMPCIVYVYLSV